MTDSTVTMGFHDFVRELTEPTGKQLVRDNGEFFIVWADPLLQRLREAVVADANGGSGAGGFESRLPLDAGAADLLIHIEREVERLYFATHHARPTDVVEVTAREWAKRVNPNMPVLYRHESSDIEMMTPLEIVQLWHRLIVNYFDSPKEVPLRGVACPACGITKTTRPADGVEEYVLKLRIERATGEVIDAFCNWCEREWERNQLVMLATETGLFAALQDITK